MSSPGVVGGGGVTPAPNYMRSAPFRRLRHPLDESPAWSLVGSLVWSFLAFCLALPLLLVLALLLPAAYLLRWTLLMLYWNRRRSQASSGGAESMSASESRWLGDSWQRSVVHAVLVFDTPPKVTDLRQLFLSRVLPLCPRLARRPLALPTVGHCWLPDTAFNIDNHVYAKPVTEEIVADAQLQEYVSTLVCEGLASDRPPWELQVVGRCAILRVHQSVADGAALTTLLCRCLADSAQKPRLQVQKHALGFYCDVLRACLLGPLTLLLWLLVSNSDCNLLTSHRQTVASSGSQGSRVKVTWTAAISFAKVTRVKQVTRSTVNCVLLSALSGALRCLLQSCGVRQPPDLKIVLPVDLGRCRHPSSGLGTRVAPVTLPLPVNTEGAVPRLWSTRRTLTALRRSTHPLIVYLATTLLMALLPSHTARHLLANIVENKASLQFSSQPGPPSLVQVGGCTLTSVYALLPAQSQLSVAVTAVTYNDQLSVTVATDATLGPAGNLLLHHLQAQIESLYELLKNRRAPGESKNENNLYRFPDVTRSPVREIAHRLNHVQEEVRRLSHHDAAGEPERLQRLKAEFSHLLRELRKRKSSGGSPDQEGDDWEKKLRSRRRSMSCSFARRPSATLIGLIANNRRPISCIEPSSALSPPSANRAQTRRNTTGCTQAMSSSSSSSSTSHSSNSSTCNRRTSTPLFSPVNDRQRLTDIKESPTKQRRPSDDVKRQTFVKSYSQPSVMPHDVQREISVSNTNLLKAANYHSQPVFRISEESPFVIPNKVPPNNEPYNLRRKLLERNIYPDYNSYINSRQSVVHRMEDSRKFEDRPVSSSSIYCDYDKHQNYESKHPKRTSDDPGMQAYPSKYSFDSELYDEILYVIKDNEQLSSLYSGFDSPRTVERTLRTTRIDGCDQEESVRNTNHYKSSPSPSSSQWVSSESRYHQYMSEQSFGDKELSTSKQIHHQNAGYTSSPKENYSWRSYDKRLKHDEEQLSSSSSSVSSPMRRRNRSSIFGRYRKFFNDVDDDEINDSNIELAGNHCYQQDVTSYENQGHSSPYSSQGPSRGYRDVIDHLSDFANTVHKFGSSSRVDASCGVHYNPKTQVHSASSSKSSLLSSSQSYGYSDGALKSRDVSPSSRSSPMNRSRSPLTTLCEETRLTSTLAIDDHQSGQDYNNQSGQDYFGHRGRGREFSAEDQPTRFLRDRQYDKALSYFVTQKINSANFHNRDTTYHQSSPSSSPNATCYTTRQQHPRSPLGDHHQLPHIEVLESSSTIYVPKYKQSLSSTASPKSNHTQEPSQVSINLEQGPSQSDQTTSLPIMSSSSSSSSNSIVSFMRIPFEDDAKVSNAEGANNGSSSGYRSKKTNYSYNNKAYDNGQDKVEFI